MKSKTIVLGLSLVLIAAFSAGYAFKTEFGKKKTLAHVVYFWAKSELTAADKQKFETGLKNLTKIKSVRQGYVGKPSATEARDVVDNSYTYSLILYFDDLKAHDAYQIDPAHLKFIEESKQYWSKVIVYDSDINAF